MKPIHVGTSPLTNRIFAGHVTKDGRAWCEGKQDVTGPACGAVAEHVIQNGSPVTVSINGKPCFIISVAKVVEVEEGPLAAIEQSGAEDAASH